MILQKHKAEMQPREEREPVPIPESHRDLLEGDACVALTTVMPDGQPQITPVWCNREGDYVLLNTMRGFRKEQNMRANPKVTRLSYDPKHPLRHLEIRGTVVEMTDERGLGPSQSPHPTLPAQIRCQVLRGRYPGFVAGDLRPGQDQAGSNSRQSRRIKQHGCSHS